MVSSTLKLSAQQVFDNLKLLTSTQKVLIAYSGGLDSHVLLHALSQFSSDHFALRAMHVHHGLLDEADSWVTHCQQVCDDLAVPLQVAYLNLQPAKGDSLEQVARTARYLALQETLQVDEVLLTAHHQNDQAETLLLQLFRGAGVQGLASMPAIMPFAAGHHARPILNQSLTRLQYYAEAHQLQHIQDPSNADSRYDRNFLRQQILPALRQRWLGIDKTIARAAAIQAETKQLLEDLAEQDLAVCCPDSTDVLPLKKLSHLSSARQKLLVRHWIYRQGFSAPSEKKLAHIFSDVIDAGQDAQPLVEWQGAQLRRYQDALYIMAPLVEHNAAQLIVWDLPSEPLKITSLAIHLAGLSSTELEKNQGKFTVRFRQGGEVFSHPERGQLNLKKYFQEQGVPPWLRSRLPLIFCDEKLLDVRLPDATPVDSSRPC